MTLQELPEIAIQIHSFIGLLIMKMMVERRSFRAREKPADLGLYPESAG
jgi:hypothetical protein